VPGGVVPSVVNGTVVVVTEVDGLDVPTVLGAVDDEHADSTTRTPTEMAGSRRNTGTG
jgi:hypothetical protein